MLRPITNIRITQIKPYNCTIDGVATVIPRTLVFDLDFAVSYTIKKGWEVHTDTCEILLPKNIRLQNGNDLFKQDGAYNVILGGTVNETMLGSQITTSPLIMAGDIVEIEDGYMFHNEVGEQITKKQVQFKGVVSNIKSGVPITIYCEDWFYLLKMTPIGVTNWTKSLISLCKHIINEVNKRFSSTYGDLILWDATDDITAKFDLGYLDIDYASISCAMVLDKLRSQYKIESFFVDNVLHFGYPIYYEPDANSSYFFSFQNNIISDNLEYKNKDTVILSAVVSCQEYVSTKTTKKGKSTKKKARKQVYVYWDITQQKFLWKDIKTSAEIPPNEGGERHDFVYPVNLSKEKQPTPQQLGEYGIETLKKYYYTGFQGSFTTFGYPFIKWNDNVNIEDAVFADRNGQYKVKSVVRSFDENGIRQEIEIDYKQQVSLPQDWIYEIMI